MVGVFDGLAELLSDVFGNSVTYQPVAGATRDVQSAFREKPIEVAGADGQIVRIDAPSWRVCRTLVEDPRRGDQILLSDGRIFTVQVVHRSGSPAHDAFWICEMQEA